MVERSVPLMSDPSTPVVRLTITSTLAGPVKVATSPPAMLKLPKLWKRLSPLSSPRSERMR